MLGKAAHVAGLGEQVRDGKLTAKEAAKLAKQPDLEPKPEPVKPPIRWNIMQKAGSPG